MTLEWTSGHLRSTLEELRSSLVLPGEKTTRAKWKSCQTVLCEGALLASRPSLAPNTPQWTYRVSRGSPPHLEAAMRAQKRNSWWNVQAQGNERASHVGSSFPPGRCGKSATRGNPSEPQRPDQCQCVVAFLSAEQTVRSSPLKA